MSSCASAAQIICIKIVTFLNAILQLKIAHHRMFVSKPYASFISPD
jgi:hypothetical protein